MDAVTHPPAPVNEPVLTYLPGSRESAALQSELAHCADDARVVGPVVAGRYQHGTGGDEHLMLPHDRHRVLFTASMAGPEQAAAASAPISMM